MNFDGKSSAADGLQLPQPFVCVVSICLSALLLTLLLFYLQARIELWLEGKAAVGWKKVLH